MPINKKPIVDVYHIYSEIWIFFRSQEQLA